MPGQRNFTKINTANILAPSASTRLTRTRGASVSEPRTQVVLSRRSNPKVDVTLFNIIGEQNGPRITRGNSTAVVPTVLPIRTISKRQDGRHDLATRKDRAAQRKRTSRRSRAIGNRRSLAAASETATHAGIPSTSNTDEQVVIDAPFVDESETTANVAVNTEESQVHRDRDPKLSITYVMASPNDPGTSAGDRQSTKLGINITAQSSAEVAAASIPLPPLSVIETLVIPRVEQSLQEIIDEMRMRPGWGTHIPQGRTPLPAGVPLIGSGSSPYPGLPSPILPQPTGSTTESNEYSSRANRGLEQAGNSEREGLYIPSIPGYNCKPTFSNGMTKYPSLIQYTTAQPPPPCPGPPCNTPAHPGLIPALPPSPFRPGMTLQRASPETEENNAYRDPDTYYGQPPSSPTLVPRDEVKARRAREKAAEEEEAEGQMRESLGSTGG
ncbi:MAG: hypothetical protein Q9218_001367 [Villophora microphyllina]